MTTETPETTAVELIADRPRPFSPAAFRHALTQKWTIFSYGVLTGLLVNVAVYLIAVANR